MDSDRRAFVRLVLVSAGAIQTGALAALCSHLVAPAAAEPATVPQSVVPPAPELWSLAAFEGLRGTCFLVAGQKLLLDQVEGHSRDGLDTVSLRFCGPARRPLDSQLHRFFHPAHPALDLFVVAGSAGDGTQLYRATICRLAPDHPSPLRPPAASSAHGLAKGPATTPV